MRFPTAITSLCLLGAALPGCAHFVEARAIKQFADAIAKDDLDAVRAQTSDHFEQKALRLDESLTDLKILRLPTGDAEIVAVEDKSDTEKLVKATVGEGKPPVLYRLLKDSKSGKWVVDDLIAEARSLVAIAPADQKDAAEKLVNDLLALRGTGHH